MNPSAINTAVWFPTWPEALRELRLPRLRQQQYRLALIRYLRFCKETRQRATVESARAFMEAVQARRLLSLSLVATWKEALNWFFTEGRKQDGAGRGAQAAPTTTRRAATAHPTNVMTDVPTLGAADLGRTPWERRLVEVLRTRHYQWRTEQAYRHWAGRFARWLETGQSGSGLSAATVGALKPLPHSRIEAATADDVRDFLTDLATRSRVSASTQKQALNALVFLLRVCHPELVEGVSLVNGKGPSASLRRDSSTSSE